MSPDILRFGIYKCKNCGDIYKTDYMAFKHKCLFIRILQEEKFDEFTIEIKPTKDSIEINMIKGKAETSYS